jgi:signal transduction histidine kinase
MKQLLILLLCVFILHLDVFAQGAKVEQWKHKINTNAADKLSAYSEWTNHLSVSNFDSCILIGKTGLAQTAAAKDSINYALITQNIGRAHYFKGRYDSAIIYYYQSLAIFERRPITGALANNLNDIAKLYRKTKDLSKALKFYKRAMEVYQSLNDKAGIAMIFNESGVVFEYMGNYEEALKRYQQSLIIQQQRKDTLGISYCYNFMAGVYVLQAEYDKAIHFNTLCLQLRQQLKDSFGLALIYSDLGAAYEAKGDYNNAIVQLSNSNTIAQNMGYLDLMATNYKNLAAIAQQQGDYKAAFDYTELYTAAKDSVYKLESSKQITEISTRYETEKKDQQLQLQQYELERKNTILGIIVGAFILMVLLAYLFYNRYKLKQQAKLQAAVLQEQEVATKAVIEAEEKERQRIAKDLHDGVGQMMSAAKMNLSALESDIGLATDEQKTAFSKIVALIDESCKEVRSVSHNMMPNALLKSGLASAIREFLDKIDSRVVKISLYTEGLHERIDANVETVLYRVIQECVNNVVKHAAAQRLDITLIKDTDGISATIEDDGIGFNTKDQSKFDGIGLKNIQTRIGFLKGSVEWDAAPGKGTVVVIQVPMV